MRYIAWIISSINVYFGLRYFLNVIHVLQSSKYSKAATIVFAVSFLLMGAAGFYFAQVKHNYKLALLIALGPWAIALLILLFNMMTGDYK